MGYRFQSNQKIDRLGKRIEYVWIGPKTETTLVFLHEGLGCVDMWRDFPARVAAEMGVRDLMWFPSASFPCHAPVIDLISGNQ